MMVRRYFRGIGVNENAHEASSEIECKHSSMVTNQMDRAFSGKSGIFMDEFVGKPGPLGKIYLYSLFFSGYSSSPAGGKEVTKKCFFS